MNIKENSVVKELADYYIKVVAGSEGTGEYAVINKTWGVLEAQTPLLPQAHEYLEQLQSHLDATQDMAEEEAESKEASDGSNVTPIKGKTH